MGRKAGSLVRGTCKLCKTVEVVSGTGSHFRCTACKAAGHRIPSAYEGVLLGWTGRPAAQNVVAQLKRLGKLDDAKQFPCVDCGRRAVEYDHRDYNRPDDVVPVCRSCNLQRGPAVPVVGSVKRLIDHGRAPYALRASAEKILRSMGIRVDVLQSMPRKLGIEHWRALLPLIEDAELIGAEGAPAVPTTTQEA